MYRILATQVNWPFFLKSLLDSLRYNVRHDELFASLWSEMLNGAPCIGFSSGRSALTAALRHGVKAPGQKVAVPSFVCASVIAAISSAQMEPLFVDISPDLTMSPECLADTITKDVAAIIMPHIYGKVCRYDEIQSIAQANKAVLIDDSAACAGLRHNGHIMGLLGDYGIGSMNYKTVNSGGGGVLIADKGLNSDLKKLTALNSRCVRYDELKTLIRFFIASQISKSYLYNVLKKIQPRKNSCLEPVDEVIECRSISRFPAMIGLAQLKTFNQMQTLREKNSTLLKKMLEDINEIEVMITDNGDFFTRFLIRMKNINSEKKSISSLQDYLMNKGVQTFLAYTPSHILSGADEYLPFTEKIYKQLLILPNNPLYTETDMIYIAEKLRNFYS